MAWSQSAWEEVFTVEDKDEVLIPEGMLIPERSMPAVVHAGERKQIAFDSRIKELHWQSGGATHNHQSPRSFNVIECDRRKPGCLKMVFISTR